MIKHLRILLLTPSYELHQRIQLKLQHTEINYEIKHVKSLSTLSDKIATNNYNLIIAHHESDTNVESFSKTILTYTGNTPCIALSESGNLQAIIRCIKMGFFSVVNPRELDDLVNVIKDIKESPLQTNKIDQSTSFKFKVLLESINHIAVQGYDKNGNVIYWNKGSENLYGYSIDEVMDKNVNDLIVPEHIQAPLMEEINRIIEQNIQAHPREITLKQKDNTPINIYSYFNVYSNEKGEKEVYFIDIDNTYKSGIQHKLEKDRAYFESLFDSTPLAIAVLNNDDELIDCNRHFEELFAFTKKELLGKEIEPLIVPKELQNERQNLIKELYKGKIIYKETVRQNKYGGLIDVSIIGKPVILNGNQISVLGIYQDITIRKEAERALMKDKEKAKTRTKIKTNFLNRISHDIRTPLNGILGFANLAIKPSIPQHLKEEYYDILQSSSDRLLNTITNYMDASLLLTNYVTPNFSNVSLSSLIFDIYELFYEKITKRNITFSMHLPNNSEEFTIRTDIELLRKIIYQLVDNALKYTESGRITIGFKQIEEQIDLFVKDTGIGIPQEQYQNLFSHFARLDNTYQNFDGSGLGLSISKGFAKLLNCEIKVKSTPKEGSKFSVIFNKKNIIENEIITNRPLDKTLNSNKTYILIVDDDETSLILLERTLKTLTKAPIITAKNGEEAVNYFTENPDAICIFMDIKMPVLDGYAAAKKIKNIQPSTPIIAVTAFAMIGDEKRAREKGCDDYITKPFTIDQISQIVKKHNILGIDQ